MRIINLIQEELFEAEDNQELMAPQKR